jgi:hypothetical protein
MTVYGCWFRYGDDSSYARLADVWKRSAERHIPGATVVLEELPALEVSNVPLPVAGNHYKFAAWVDAARENRGSLILMDTDMLVTGDLSRAFEMEFDAAVTRRTDAPMPYNGGVVFLRGNDKSRDFIDRWWHWELEYMSHRDEYKPYYRRFCGPNQTALGLLLERDAHGLNIAELPCAEWNACPDDFGGIAEGKTKAIHLKGRMDKFALSDLELRKVPEELRAGVKLWREHENYHRTF